MKGEPFFPETSKNEEVVSLNEIAYVWAEPIRNQRYKDLIGQFPSPTLSEEQVAYGILHPEEEKLKVLQRNQEDDKTETTEIYRR